MNARVMPVRICVYPLHTCVCMHVHMCQIAWLCDGVCVWVALRVQLMCVGQCVCVLGICAELNA